MSVLLQHIGAARFGRKCLASRLPEWITTVLPIWGVLLILGLVPIWQSAAEAAEGPAAIVRVRIGEHTGYSRIVFDWLQQVPYRVTVQSGVVTVYFGTPASFDLSRYRRNPPPLMTDIVPFRTESGAAVQIRTPEGATARHFRHGTKIAIDILEPVARPRARQPDTRQTQATPVPRAKPAAPSAGAKATAAPAARPTQPAAPATAPATATTAPAKSPPKKPRSKSVYRPPGSRSLTLGGNISTLGLGGEAGYRFNDYLGLRIAGNYLSRSFEDSLGGIDYNDIDFQLASAGALIDVYPFGRMFRLTGGLRYNANEISLETTTSSNTSIGNGIYTPSQIGTLRGNIDFWPVAPYAGLGLEGRFFRSRFVLGLDLGVYFQGSPEIDLSATGTASGNPTFEADLRNEEKDIEDDLALLGVFDFQYYPVIAITGSYRF